MSIINYFSIGKYFLWYEEVISLCSGLPEHTSRPKCQLKTQIINQNKKCNPHAVCGFGFVVFWERACFACGRSLVWFPMAGVLLVMIWSPSRLLVEVQFQVNPDTTINFNHTYNYNQTTTNTKVGMVCLLNNSWTTKSPVLWIPYRRKWTETRWSDAQCLPPK